jgi:hypothetical protein
MDIITEKLRNTRIETELLEILDWEDEVYKSLINDLEEMFTSIRDANIIKYKIEDKYGKEVWSLVYKELKIDLNKGSLIEN